jgi:hypothetical protein
MHLFKSARLVASALLLSALSLARLNAEQLALAAERPDGACPADSKVLGIARLGAALPEGSSSARCVFLASLAGLTDAEIDDAVTRLAAVHPAAGLMLSLPAGAETDRVAYAVKRLSSIFRSGSPDGKVALYADEAPTGNAAEELAPYVDALILRPGRASAPSEAEAPERVWVLAPVGVEGSTGSAADAVLRAVAERPRATLAAAIAEGRPLTDGDVEGLARLAKYFTADTSPTRRRRRHAQGRLEDGGAAILRREDLLADAPAPRRPSGAAWEARIELSVGPVERASVENLASGVRRDFELKGGTALTLDLSKGPLAVSLKPMAKAGGETRAAVDVGATRGLSAEEIIARERAWDAGQREKYTTYSANLDTSLRFRIADFQDSLDLTIRGPTSRQGKPPTGSGGIS